MGSPPSPGPWLSWALDVALIALSVSVVLASFRVVYGPTLPDRIIALDLVAYHLIAVIATRALETSSPGFLTVALALGLVSFLGTVAFARYLEESSQRERLEGQEREPE